MGCNKHRYLCSSCQVTACLNAKFWFWHLRTGISLTGLAGRKELSEKVIQMWSLKWGWPCNMWRFLGRRDRAASARLCFFAASFGQSWSQVCYTPVTSTMITSKSTPSKIFCFHAHLLSKPHCISATQFRAALLLLRECRHPIDKTCSTLGSFCVAFNQQL